MTKLTNVSGLSGDVEFGPNGPRVKKVGSNVELLRNDGSLSTARIADGTASDHGVTVGQLDAAMTGVGGYQSYEYDATGALTQLSGQGSGDGGDIRKNDTFEITSPGTVLGKTVQVGDRLVANIANPDLTPNDTTNLHWRVDDFKQPGQLVDNVTVESVSEKIQLKDRGTTGTKLALQTVLDENMADDSIPERAIQDRVVGGVNIKLGTILDENHGLGEIQQDKLDSSVSTKLDKGATVHDTEIPNIELAFGGSINFATDNSLSAHSDIMTNTTLIGKLDQAEVEMVRIVADSAARKSTVTYNGGASQNIGSQVPAGRDATTVYITPSNTANTGDLELEIQTSTGTVIVPKGSIDVTQDGEVQVYPVSFNCAVSTQFVAVVTSSTATSGSFRVMIEHI